MTLHDEPDPHVAGTPDGGLLSIGRFARLSGLSIGALRHYDEIGLLAPAETDRVTGYRRYRRDHEALARACRVAGDRLGAERWLAAARAAAADVTDSEDRELLLADLATI